MPPLANSIQGNIYIGKAELLNAGRPDTQHWKQT